MPIYPPIDIEGQIYYITEDPLVFIESYHIFDVVTGEADNIVYINFRDGLRWRQTGRCNACGIGDVMFLAEGKKGKRVGAEDYIITVGKQMGEAGSTIDPTYTTRLDSPSTPDADRLGRKMAAILGIDYGCGLTFEWLSYPGP